MPVLKRHWESNIVDIPSTSVPVKIVELLPGEAVVITSLAGSTNSIYLGSDDTVISTNCYELKQAKSIKFALDKDTEPGTKMEIWGLAANAGDDVTYAKIVGKAADIEAT